MTKFRVLQLLNQEPKLVLIWKMQVSQSDLNLLEPLQLKIYKKCPQMHIFFSILTLIDNYQLVFHLFLDVPGQLDVVDQGGKVEQAHRN